MLAVSQRLARERPALRVLPAGHTFTAAGRTVVVTGSSRGIGKGIAMVFAEAGANVIINSRHLDEAEATAAELVAAGGEASAFAGDVSSEADMQALMATAVERYGGLDVVCANAGIIPDETMEGVSVAEWDRAFEINVRGSFLAVKTALPYLKQSSAGRVVLTSSITGPITVTPPCGSNPGVAEGSAPRTSVHGPRLATGLPGLGPLRRHQGGAAGLHALGRDGARGLRHHDQRHPAGQHHH